MSGTFTQMNARLTPADAAAARVRSRAGIFGRSAACVEELDRQAFEKVRQHGEALRLQMALYDSTLTVLDGVLSLIRRTAEETGWTGWMQMLEETRYAGAHD